MIDGILGKITLLGGRTTPAGYLKCDGALHPVASHPRLAKLLGSRFGGDGTTTFGVPKLAPPAGNLAYIISSDGFDCGDEANYASPLVGTVALLPFTPTPTWEPCDGGAFNPKEYPLLGARLGSQFGWGSANTYRRPKLNPVKTVDGKEIAYSIATSGYFDADGSMTSDGEFIGQIDLYATELQPGNHAPCDGAPLGQDSGVLRYALSSTNFPKLAHIPNVGEEAKVRYYICQANGIYPS